MAVFRHPSPTEETGVLLVASDSICRSIRDFTGKKFVVLVPLLVAIKVHELYRAGGFIVVQVDSRGKLEHQKQRAVKISPFPRCRSNRENAMGSMAVARPGTGSSRKPVHSSSTALAFRTLLPDGRCVVQGACCQLPACENGRPPPRTSVRAGWSMGGKLYGQFYSDCDSGPASWSIWPACGIFNWR